MNKRTILTTAFCTAFILSACGTKKQASDSAVTISDNDFTVDYNIGSAFSDDAEYVSRTLDLAAFSAISVNQMAAITYHQGSKRKVTVRTTPSLWGKLNFKVVDGTFCVEAKEGVKNISTNIGDVYIDITCPSLKSLRCNGALSFSTTDMSAAALSVHNNGSMTLKFSTLRCDDFEVQNNGALTLCGDVTAQNVSLRNNGSLKVTDKYTVRSQMNVHNCGANTMVCDISSPSLRLQCNGSDNYELNVKGGNMYADVAGSGNLNGSFSGSELTVNGSGRSTIDLNVDCRSLKVDADGVANVTLRGTADKTDIESSGVAKVSTSGLNKF